MKERGITAKKVATDTGLTNSLFTQWKQGLQKPSAEAIVKLSDYFGVTTDFLLKGKEPQKILRQVKNKKDDVDMKKYIFTFEYVLPSNSKETKVFNNVIGVEYEGKISAESTTVENTDILEHDFRNAGLFFFKFDEEKTQTFNTRIVGVLSLEVKETKNPFEGGSLNETLLKNRISP
jgi:transcriptional regulator with XRE-family HTH domain